MRQVEEKYIKENLNFVAFSWNEYVILFILPNHYNIITNFLIMKTALLMAMLACTLEAPPLWSTVKYLNKYYNK